MSSPLSTDRVGPRTAYAREAFTQHFLREPMPNHAHDAIWIAGYLAALEDLADESLDALGLL